MPARPRWLQQSTSSDGRHGTETFRTLTLHLEIDIGNIAAGSREISTCSLSLGGSGPEACWLLPPVSVPTKRSFPAPRRVRIAPLQVDLDRCNISHSLCLDVAATGARCKRCVERYVLSVSWAGPISNLTGLFGSPAISPRDDGPTLNRSDLPVAVYGAYKQKQAPTLRPLWSSISYRKPSMHRKHMSSLGTERNWTEGTGGWK